jgi:hypothetical protein
MATKSKKAKTSKTLKKGARGPSKKRTPPKPAKKQATAPRPKTFIEKVRDCDVGTGIWFITAGSVEHARIERRGDDGAAVIRTDAGVTEIIPMRNLFETADQARAARY